MAIAAVAPAGDPASGRIKTPARIKYAGPSFVDFIKWKSPPLRPYYCTTAVYGRLKDLRGSLLGLFYPQHAIHRHIAQYLPYSARPREFNFAGGRRTPEPKMHPGIARGCVPCTGSRVIVLHAPIGSGEPNAGADAHAVTLRPNQLQREPVVPVFGGVMQNTGRAVQDRYHQIDPAVVIEVPKRQSPMRRGDLEIRAGSRADILEAPIAQIAEHRIRLGR